MKMVMTTHMATTWEKKFRWLQIFLMVYRSACSSCRSCWKFTTLCRLPWGLAALARLRGTGLRWCTRTLWMEPRSAGRKPRRWHHSGQQGTSTRPHQWTTTRPYRFQSCSKAPWYNHQRQYVVTGHQSLSSSPHCHHWSPGLNAELLTSAGLWAHSWPKLTSVTNFESHPKNLQARLYTTLSPT